MPAILGRILCFIGLHDFEVVDVTMGFGAGGNVAKVRCRRCGRTSTRRS